MEQGPTLLGIYEVQKQKRHRGHTDEYSERHARHIHAARLLRVGIGIHAYRRHGVYILGIIGVARRGVSHRAAMPRAACLSPVALLVVGIGYGLTPPQPSRPPVQTLSDHHTHGVAHLLGAAAVGLLEGHAAGVVGRGIRVHPDGGVGAADGYARLAHYTPYAVVAEGTHPSARALIVGKEVLRLQPSVLVARLVVPHLVRLHVLDAELTVVYVCRHGGVIATVHRLSRHQSLGRIVVARRCSDHIAVVLRHYAAPHTAAQVVEAQPVRSAVVVVGSAATATPDDEHQQGQRQEKT